LVVTALSETRLALALTLQASDKPLLSSIDLQQLPPGTQLQGRVEARETAQQGLYRLVVNLLNTPLAGSRLSVETPLPLPLGSLLTARVQDSQALVFLPLSGRLDQLLLSQQLATQQSRQGSLESLFKGLQGMATQSPLPQELRSSIDKLFGLLPDGKQLSTPQGLAK